MVLVVDNIDESESDRVLVAGNSDINIQIPTVMIEKSVGDVIINEMKKTDAVIMTFKFPDIP